MDKNRIVSFTDGVVSIVITLLIFNIRIPTRPVLSSLRTITPLMLTYLVSFIFIAVIWVSHHRLFGMANRVSNAVIWADLFWLFWLTLCPAVTLWVGHDSQNMISFLPEFAYLVVFTMWSFSFSILTHYLLKANPDASKLQWAVKNDRRSQISLLVSVMLFFGVFYYPPIVLIGRFLISGIWVFPYRVSTKIHHSLLDHFRK
ncbi:TMEM175 family protein [Levilactobacillus bambusae]|uniref:DUF1211 domain-containing membrane protein n=1 Tax=Levilactobacillus bambusae TaxID=2024736 RepID=A0A2V1MWS8_9LACO|nr:TMEM175 family protein [Levilactobacillus bambusae]PWF99496.1 DUF1211 domain-containing membrane protein [Levilactobacillus bambusae]